MSTKCNKTWTDTAMMDAIRSSQTIAEVLKKLNLNPYGAAYRTVYNFGIRHAIDMTRFRRPKANLNLHTDEEFSSIVRNHKSFEAVITAMGITRSGTTQRYVRLRISSLNLDISHFNGQGWRKGLSAENDERIRQTGLRIRLPHDKLFCTNSTAPRSSVKRDFLEIRRERDLPICCDECQLSEWRSKTLLLILDHINGINNDNRIENLRLLCPNCNSQTDTFAGRNLTKSKIS